MIPVVNWRLMTWNDLVKGKNRSKSRYEIIWDGEPENIKPAPEGYSFCGGLLAFVGDQNIGDITMYDTHRLNHIPRIVLIGYSMFFPKKKNGGYGKDFGDEEDYRTGQISKRFDLDAAKAYVERPFFEFCEKAGLIQEASNG